MYRVIAGRLVSGLSVSSQSASGDTPRLTIEVVKGGHGGRRISMLRYPSCRMDESYTETMLLIINAIAVCACHAMNVDKGGGSSRRCPSVPLTAASGFRLQASGAHGSPRQRQKTKGYTDTTKKTRRRRKREATATGSGSLRTAL